MSIKISLCVKMQVITSPISVMCPCCCAVGESDSGMDGEFISVSQRGMYLTETDVSEGEEERDVTARVLSDPGKISLKRRPASSFIDRPDYVQGEYI